jgi:hypothetical protein
MPTKGTLIVMAVSFVSGLGIATYVVSRWCRLSRLLRWDIAGQSHLVPQQLSEIIGLPVSMRVGEQEINSFSVVSVSLTSAGTLTLASLVCLVTGNDGSEVLGVKIIEGGIRADNVSCNIDNHYCRINVKKLDPGENVFLEIIVRDYEYDSLKVEVFDPAITVVRGLGFVARQAARMGPNFSVNLIIARYEATARAMNVIADQVTTIRRIIARSQPPLPPSGEE